jgi:hypothetical protein
MYLLPVAEPAAWMAAPGSAACWMVNGSIMVL